VDPPQPRQKFSSHVEKTLQHRRTRADRLEVPTPLVPLNWPWTCVSRTELELPHARRPSFDLVGALPPRPRLAIVGSRAAHRRVLVTLGPIIAAAAERGWSLISGGALGIDGGAHRAALGQGVAQLAVLPCGRDRVYPPGHAPLFAAMVASGEAGLLFAHPPGTATVRAMFASRNAIVVGLADAVLVAQAGLRSGSTGTGRLALRQAVPLAAIAGSPGCGALIGLGARPLPSPPYEDDPQALASVADAVGGWLDVLQGGAEPDGGASASAWPDHLRWLEAAVREAGPQGLSIDTLPQAGAATLAVCEAELLGLICEAAAGRWVGLG